MLSAKETLFLLGEAGTSLNLDTHLTREMPSVLPGEEGFSTMIQKYNESGFRSLANALEFLHWCKKRQQKDKNFPSREHKVRFETTTAIIEDLENMILENKEILTEKAVLKDNDSYRGEKTTILELTLTFYEIVLRKLEKHNVIQNWYPANQRAETLRNQPNIKLTPLIKKAI